MVDLKLKKITLRNWAKFGPTELEFPDSGLVMVVGINNASGGALQSVGSGKTAFGEAISRTLLGVPGRKTYMKDFSRDQQGDMYVRVEATFLDKPLIVEAGYQCEELNPKSEALRFTYDNQLIERGHIRQTREELIRLLQVPPLLAAWTVFVDGRHMDFTQMEQADSVELVMSALRQPPWSAYHELSKKTLANFRRSLAKDEQSQQEAHRRVGESTGDVEDAREDVEKERREFDRKKRENDQQVQRLQEGVQRITDRIAAQKTRLTELNAAMKQIEETKATAHHALEIQIRETQETLRVLRTEAKPFQEAVNAALTTATEARTHYTSYRDMERECPTCKRAFDAKKLDGKRLSWLKAQHEDAAKAHRTAQDRLRLRNDQIDAQATLLESLQEQARTLSVQHDLTTLSGEYATVEQSMQENLDLVRQREQEITTFQSTVSDAGVKAAEATLIERERMLAKAKQQLEDAATALTISQSTLKVLDYWNIAFSPYGIPNMVLRDAIDPLNHEAQRVSALLTGGTIQVVYNTSREMASGMEKARLNIEVNNLLGDKDLTGSSKGEAGLANFIIAETLAEVGQTARRVGYRWYDEVVPHQDAKVCHTLYTYWKEVARKLGILIFMVDHNPIAANYADYTLVVEKKGSPTSCLSFPYWR